MKNDLSQNILRKKILKATEDIALLKFLSKFVSADVGSLYGDVIYHNQRIENDEFS